MPCERHRLCKALFLHLYILFLIRLKIVNPRVPVILLLHACSPRYALHHQSASFAEAFEPITEQQAFITYQVFPSLLVLSRFRVFARKQKKRGSSPCSLFAPERYRILASFNQLANSFLYHRLIFLIGNTVPFVITG